MLAAEPRVIRAWRNGWDARHYIQLLRWRQAGFRPKVIYDIGAYDGRWSQMCSALFAPRQIVLFEPQQELQQALRSRQREDWKILPFALGAQNTVQEFHLTSNRSAGSLLMPVLDDDLAASGTDVVGSESVSVRTLDSVVAAEQLEAPDLIKLDVQGFEEKVLEGGKTTFAKTAKLVIEVSIREVYAGQPLLLDILQKVAPWGFVVEDITEALRQWPSGELWQVDLWLNRKAGPW